jgi:hypothetical protein
MKLSQLCLEMVSGNHQENKKLVQKMISKQADEATPNNQNDDPEFHKRLAQKVAAARSETNKMSPDEIKSKIHAIAGQDAKHTKVDDMARKYIKG